MESDQDQFEGKGKQVCKLERVTVTAFPYAPNVFEILEIISHFHYCHGIEMNCNYVQFYQISQF